MSSPRTPLLGLAVVAVAATALTSPAQAKAAVFPVSRTIGVYAQPNVSQGISTIPGGGSVDVRCWINGQRIGGYAVWDQITFRGATAWVHDLYVQMPNQTSPAANGIPQCGAGREGRAPVQGRGTLTHSCGSRWMSEAWTRGQGRGFVVHMRPTGQARALGSSSLTWPSMWNDLRACVLFDSSLSPDQLSSMYKQLACHAVYAKHERVGGGPTWDLEAFQRNVSWPRALLFTGRSSCNWDNG